MSARLRTGKKVGQKNNTGKSPRPDNAENSEEAALDLFFMEKCLVLSEKAAKKGDVPVGCIVVCGNKVVSKAFNVRERRLRPYGSCRDTRAGGGGQKAEAAQPFGLYAVRDA